MLLSIVSRVLRLGQDLPLVKHCEYAKTTKTPFHCTGLYTIDQALTLACSCYSLHLSCD